MGSCNLFCFYTNFENEKKTVIKASKICKIMPQNIFVSILIKIKGLE